MQTSLWRARFDTAAPVRAPLARCNGENRVVSRIAIAFLALSFIAAGLDSTFGRDPVDVNANAYPWSSVGKIYNSARSSCTGSVIAPNRVLTAAHCLYNRATHRFLQAGSLHFLLGYKGGEYRTHARVASYLVGSDYNPEDAKASVRADWAILVLAEDTETTPLRLSQSPSVAGERIMVGGFSQKYPFKMTADTECQIRGVMTNGLILHDCAVMHGISGAPIMKAITETDVQIVGVHVASGQVMGSPTAFAVPASSFAQRAFPPRDALK